MGCTMKRKPDGAILFVCGKDLSPYPCRVCGMEADYLCDYPIDHNKTCDSQMCEHHLNEVAPGIHFCKAHYEEYKNYDKSGAVRKRLDNVVPYARRYLK